MAVLPGGTGEKPAPTPGTTAARLQKMQHQCEAPNPPVNLLPHLSSVGLPELPPCPYLQYKHIPGTHHSP